MAIDVAGDVVWGRFDLTACSLVASFLPTQCATLGLARGGSAPLRSPRSPPSGGVRGRSSRPFPVPARPDGGSPHHHRSRQIARIGNNLNQIARWANTFKASAEAVEVIAHLIAIERALLALTSVRFPDPDAH